jgi:hypothetical protein
MTSKAIRHIKSTGAATQPTHSSFRTRFYTQLFWPAPSWDVRNFWWRRAVKERPGVHWRAMWAVLPAVLANFMSDNPGGDTACPCVDPRSNASIAGFANSSCVFGPSGECYPPDYVAQQHAPAGMQSCRLSVRSLVFPIPAPQIIARNHGASLTPKIASDRTILHWHIQACITAMRHAGIETLSLLSDLLPPTRDYASHSQTILGLATRS